MTDDSKLLEELKGLIGTKTDPGFNEVEKGSIRRYADAVGNPNPLHSDIEYAKKSRHGGIIAPPGFFGWPKQVNTGAIEVMGPVFGAVFNAGLIRILDAGIEYDFFLPIHAGDTLTWFARFADVKERDGKSGRMVFLTMELTYMNQNGDLVAKARQTFLAR